MGSRRTSAPLAISPAMPTTLNWYPISPATRGCASGMSAPNASIAHGDVGRCIRRETTSTENMAADRTAGDGAPTNATNTTTMRTAAASARRIDAPPISAQHHRFRQHRHVQAGDRQHVDDARIRELAADRERDVALIGDQQRPRQRPGRRTGNR